MVRNAVHRTRLPVTHFEIVTLAHAAMNFVIYIFWWNKPLNVNRPVRVFRKSERSEMQPQPVSEARELTWMAVFEDLGMISQLISGGQDLYADLSRKERVPRFGANSTDRDSNVTNLKVLGVGACLWSIAWAFSFPTHAELLIWRISSVAITTVPAYFFLTIGSNSWLSNMHSKTVGIVIVAGIIYFTILLAFIMYIIARAVTLILAFRSFRGLPLGSFDTVRLTTFISHV